MLDTTLKVKTLEVELDLERFTNSEIVKNIEKRAVTVVAVLFLFIGKLNSSFLNYLLIYLIILKEVLASFFSILESFVCR